MTRAAIFDRFEPWSGEVAAGWSANFLGVLTRQEYTVGMTGVMDDEDREVVTALPPVDEEYLEWIDLLEAVVDTPVDETFTMVELGAGYGRWLVCAAAAFHRSGGRAVRLVGVEAEPTHFRWMRQHVRDNNIAEASVTLIEAAVAKQAGRVRFHVGDASAWYGQAIDSSQPASEGAPLLRRRLRTLVNRRRRGGSRSIVEVPAVTLQSLLEPLHVVDLIDLDIQGAEAEVLESARSELDRKVRRAHVGTHSEDNERQLRTLFGDLGWELRNDYACGSTAETPWGMVQFQDGVQTWINDRLATRSR